MILFRRKKGIPTSSDFSNVGLPIVNLNTGELYVKTSDSTVKNVCNVVDSLSITRSNTAESNAKSYTDAEITKMTDGSYTTFRATNSSYTLKVGTSSSHPMIGSTTLPTYVDSDGSIKSISYTISKSVPSDAKFTDTIYTLPSATTTALGGIKIGYSETGQHYAVKLGAENKAYVTVPWTNTTYTAGTGLSLSNTTFSLNSTNLTALSGYDSTKGSIESRLTNLGFNSESVDIWQLFNDATGSKTTTSSVLKKEGHFYWLDLDISVPAAYNIIRASGKSVTKTYSYVKPNWLPSNMSSSFIAHCRGAASTTGGGGLWEADLPITINTLSNTYTLSFTLSASTNYTIVVHSITCKSIVSSSINF